MASGPRLARPTLFELFLTCPQLCFAWHSCDSNSLNLLFVSSNLFYFRFSVHSTTAVVCREQQQTVVLGGMRYFVLLHNDIIAWRNTGLVQQQRPYNVETQDEGVPARGDKTLCECYVDDAIPTKQEPKAR